MPATVAFRKRHCLFCKDSEKIIDLYPRTFSEHDLTPAVFSARRVTEHFHYQIVRCENCSLVFSREVLEETNLKDLYEESTVTFDQYTPVLRRDYWRPIAPYFKNPQGSSALEIGCSSGFFLEELLARGFSTVRGVEPSREAIQKAAPSVQGGIINGFFEGLQTFPAEKFDLVCTFQTLDHIYDPVHFIKNCLDVLKPGGKICIVVHDTESLQAKILGEKSPIIDIEHVYLFNKKTLRRILADNGFSVRAVGHLKNSYPIKYWMGMTPMPASVKKVMSHAISLVGLSNFSPAISAGNLFAVAEKP